MKKVFQIKLKNITKVFALVMAASLVTFTGCKSYDEDISGLQTQIDQVVTDINGLETAVNALQTSVNGMTYIKSIALGTDGKLTITPSTGSNIVYDAKTYVTYDVTLTNNVLTVNGVNKGTVTIPALTFGADNKLMSGTTVVADLSSWVRTLTLSTDNYLVINGVKSTILIPSATVQSVDVKGITISGNVLTITKNDNSTSTITLPQTALTLTAVSSNDGELTLNLNGVDTKVTIKNTFSVVGGFLTVNGVATTVAIPAENKSTVIINKVGGVIVSATISDGTDSFTVKVNPTNELLAGLLFVPTVNEAVIEAGVNTVDYGYMNGINVSVTPNVIVKSLFQIVPLTFRFNPSEADLSGTTWSFLSNSAVFRAPSAGVPGDVSGLFAPVTTFTDLAGAGTFALKALTDPFVGVDAGNTVTGTKRIISLQATSKDFFDNTKTKIVTSDLVKLQPVQFTPYISNATLLPSYVHYRTSKPAAVVPNPLVPDPANDPEFTLISDNSGVPTDLDNLVLASTKKGSIEKKFDDYGFTDYHFTYTLEPYVSSDATDQNTFVTLNPTTNVLTVNAGSSVINRTPLVTVKLWSNTTNYLLATAYIKFQIVPPGTSQGGTTNFTVPSASFTYPSLFVDAVAGVSPGDYKDVVLTWPDMNNHVYNPMGLTHNQFQTMFGSINPTVTYSFAPGAGSTAPAVGTISAPVATTLTAFPLIRSIHNPDVDTYAMKVQVTPLAKFGTYVINYKFDDGVATNPKAVITFTYTVTAPTLTKTILPGYQYLVGNTTNVMTQGMNVGGAYLMQIYLGEAFGYGSAAYRGAFGTGASLIDGATHQFVVTSDPYAAAVTPSTVSYLINPGAASTINTTLGTGTATGTLLSINPANPLNIAERIYPVNFKTTYPNAEIDNFNYNVHFRNPLTIVPSVDYKNYLTDFKTGVADTWDISKNYDIQMLGTTVVHEGVYQSNSYGITAGNSTLSYPALTNVSATYVTFSLAGSTITWSNAGTRLTSDQVVGNTNVLFTAPFATVGRTDAITVKWDQTASPVKRK